MVIGLDNNSDGDYLDAGDAIQSRDDFNSSNVTLVYDDNGNLARDGVFNYVYDAWNRLRQVQRYDADDPNDATTIAEYEYDGKNRRTQKVVTNSGVEDVPNDGGNTTLHYYYDNRWRIIEERNGSNEAVRQYVWGTRYTDELICIDINGDAANGNDCDPDVADPNDTDDDARYFVHQDRNWNVQALTAYSPDPNDPNTPTNGQVVERYTYTPYGTFTVLKGAASGNNEADARLTSIIGNVFTHQGLPFDAEKLCYQNRWRDYSSTLISYVQRDPRRPFIGATHYRAFGNSPPEYVDPLGLEEFDADCDKACQELEAMGHWAEGGAGAGAGAATFCCLETMGPLPEGDDGCRTMTCYDPGLPEGSCRRVCLEVHEGVRQGQFTCTRVYPPCTGPRCRRDLNDPNEAQRDCEAYTAHLDCLENNTACPQDGMTSCQTELVRCLQQVTCNQQMPAKSVLRACQGLVHDRYPSCPEPPGEE